MADTDAARDLYRRWIQELWNGDPNAAVDLADELVTDDFVGHWPDNEVTGPRTLGDLIKQTHGAFDQLSFVITVGPVVDGELAAGRWAGSGEDADGPSTFFGNDILRVSDGRIAEFWASSSAGRPADQVAPGLSPEQKGERSADHEVEESADEAERTSDDAGSTGAPEDPSASTEDSDKTEDQRSDSREG